MPPPRRELGLRALVDEAAHVVPGLHGHVVAAAADVATPWHATAELASVQRYWASRYPEAGPHYAALRGWGLLVWQPIYLGVIAAHTRDASLDLDRVSLVIDDGAIQAYKLWAHADVVSLADETARLQAAARQLSAGIVALLPRWQACATLHAKAARRTCADCALAALLAVQRRHRWPLTRARDLGERWLAALDLSGESGFLAYRTAAGDEALALAHKVCCLHFRRRDGDRCSTCPKRSVAERIECLLAEG
ncbi:MAG TPA: siderophore ferric iron reductase [Burkholderiaceae bacterium]